MRQQLKTGRVSTVSAGTLLAALPLTLINSNHCVFAVRTQVLIRAHSVLVVFALNEYRTIIDKLRGKLAVLRS